MESFEEMIFMRSLHQMLFVQNAEHPGSEVLDFLAADEPKNLLPHWVLIKRYLADFRIQFVHKNCNWTEVFGAQISCVWISPCKMWGMQGPKIRMTRDRALCFFRNRFLFEMHEERTAGIIFIQNGNSFRCEISRFFCKILLLLFFPCPIFWLEQKSLPSSLLPRKFLS